MKFVTGLALSAVLCGGAAAQEAAPAESAAATATEAAVGSLPAGSIVDIEVAETLNSKTHKRGDTFAIRLAVPVATDAGVLIPAGTPGRGEVISASRAGMLGKAGELLLAARYLEFNGEKVPLRAFKLGASGKNNTAVVLALGMVVPVSFLIPGGDIEVPVGTAANAKLAVDISLPLLPPPPSAADVSTTTQEENTQ